MISPQPHASSGGGLGRALRYLYRVPLLLIHILVLLPLVLLSMVPLWSGVRVGGLRVEHLAIKLWSAGLMRIFGFRLRRIGTPLPDPAMFVANHVSWVDIEMLHSQRMMGFVAKQEIRGWPVVGWLTARGETIFHQRGSQESMGGVMHAMLARLRDGRPVGVFPEGRTRDGSEVGPFHARIFQPAVEAAVPVQPVALRYGPRGSAQTVVAFGAGESFFANFMRLLGEPPRSADICFLTPIAAGELEGRSKIAELARERIVAAMESDR
ncbi:lysophospholipid acyltransferase family protein [Pseudoxanthomonas sacheonensis]|uniref:lysophospholipid acyltransferase family protein n=1 Tax=Pseudoxanthomonas sacheonensis TaxID=443615 RepID=UPI0013D0DCFD|nr:lysophospholipid acyltransferase family protein [Pseudoxanthomonas sacheonensis]KAF1709067.1 1-acyl-sn-glycerol-3-phosphate acyltransferase [Pseudoxanthomonas sacheonensis]